MESYVTLTELNTLVEELFDVDEELAEVSWSTRTEKSKNVHLGKAMRAVESLRYLGEMAQPLTQTLQFPRYIGDEYSILAFMPINLPVNTLTYTGIPDNLKQCVAHLTVLSMQNSKNTRVKLQRQGVKLIISGRDREEYIDNHELFSGTVPTYIQDLYLKNLLYRGISG